jgi:FkbH-like protein
LEPIFVALDEKPTLARTIRAVRELEQLHRRRPEVFITHNVAIIRNFTIEPIDPLLKLAAYRAGIHVDVSYSGYSPTVDQAVNAIAAVDPSVVLIFQRVDELASALARDFLGTDVDLALELSHSAVEHVVSIVHGVRASSSAAVLVHNFVVPVSPVDGLVGSQNPLGQLNVVRRMNLSLSEKVANIDGVYLLDVDHLFGRIGLLHCYDNRGARQSDAPLSQVALTALAAVQVRHIEALSGPAVKCIVVDCDNTLWGGVIGEDGLSGIVLDESGLGRMFHDFQQALLNLRRRGTVLAICSKNEDADVIEVLRKHPSCVLSEEDFAARRINWDDKAANIVSLANELNLDISHMLFIDDDPMQCELVGRTLPDLRVLQWPDFFDHLGSLDDLALFDSMVSTTEDRHRTEMYRAEADRRATREKAASPEAYFPSLQLTATVGVAQPQDLQRISQLTQRTNQFNLTTRRYEVADLEPMIEVSDTRMLWVELRDRFGVYGVTGCGIIRLEGAAAVIDTFLLSCRVLGRSMETVLVNRLAAQARTLGATVLIGEYIPSDRNGQVADLYGRLGFEALKTDNHTHRWQWLLSAGNPTIPEWIDVIDAEGMSLERRT